MSGKNKIGITETILRDAHQSLMATRMRRNHMLEVAEQIDSVGYHSLEAWGGATFDASLRYLKESPWETLRKLRERITKTPLQMLLRGQNLLAYRNYPDDVVEAFVRHSVENGIKIVRVFDALNDVRNMELSIKTAKQAGAHAQGTIVYTISPVHNLDYYVRVGKALKEMGADSICIKDMAGLITPTAAYNLTKRLKAEVGLPVQLHSHYTSGLAGMAYFKAAEAGVDVIDTALSALAFGSSQPATETMVAALKETEYDTGLDLGQLKALNQYFKEIKKEYGEVVAPLRMDPEVLSYQIPGGMLSNLRSQLMEQGMVDKIEEVFAEVPRVRQELGYPPLVTPMSQIVGTQSVFNVVTGQRYGILSKEVKDYVKGLYGQPPGEISEEIKSRIVNDGEVVTCRPADLLKPGLPTATDELKKLGYSHVSEEEVLAYIMFPEQTKAYLNGNA
ncbi:MAG: pyruvate carboxylase subunit B [Limnochordia bacterium]|nr:pyruvate carboxylase subunit B [Limnochordia bacterium]